MKYLDLVTFNVQGIALFHAEIGSVLLFKMRYSASQISSLFYMVIDKERRKGNKAGQLLFLCSASIDLLQQSSESLVGRIAYIELRGIDVLEYANRQSEKINEFWLRQHICIR